MLMIEILPNFFTQLDKHFHPGNAMKIYFTSPKTSFIYFT